MSFLGLTAGVRLFGRPPVALGGWVGRRCAWERRALRCLAAPRCACCLRWLFCFCWALGRCGGRRWALRCLAAPRCACCLRWPFCFRWALGLCWAPRSRAVLGASLLLLVAGRLSTFHGVWVGPAAASAGMVTGPRKTTAASGHSHERSVRWIRFIDCLRFCVERHDNATPAPFQGHVSAGVSSPAEPPAATFFLSPGLRAPNRMIPGFERLRGRLAASGCIDDALRHRLLRPPGQASFSLALGPTDSFC